MDTLVVKTLGCSTAEFSDFGEGECPTFVFCEDCGEILDECECDDDW